MATAIAIAMVAKAILSVSELTVLFVMQQACVVQNEFVAALPNSNAKERQ